MEQHSDVGEEKVGWEGWPSRIPGGPVSERFKTEHSKQGLASTGQRLGHLMGLRQEELVWSLILLVSEISSKPVFSRK